MEQHEQGGAYGADAVAAEHDDDERNSAVLNALAVTIINKRAEAVAARQSCGIETEWLGDDEFYQGYDDANRHEFAYTAQKPVQGTGNNAPVVKQEGKGSVVFPNITQPYVDAAAARVGDMLLPTDDRNFAIEPTPIPDLFEGLEQAIAANQPQPAAAPIPAPGMQAQGMGIPGMPQQSAPQQPPAPVGDEPQVNVDGIVMAVSQAKAKFDAMKEDAKRRADKAQEQVDDWLMECQYHAEMRKVIDDAARLGSGVIKGPVPVKRKATAWHRNPMSGVYEMKMVEEIKPASFRVDPWDLFPDPACGESIHRGDYVFERDRQTRKCLEAMKGLPGYLDEAIEHVLKEGPSRVNEADSRHLMSDNYSRKSQFEVWYYHGNITGEELRCAGVDFGTDGEDDGENEGEGEDSDDKIYPAIITMVNDTIIRASLNPLDDGQFPYDVIPWKRRTGMPWGMGVARQMRTPQRIVVAACRNLMDNAGLAAGPQIVLREGTEPANGVYEIRPLKIWRRTDDSNPQMSGSPVESVTIPMLQAELMAIIQFGMKMAEDVTGLPMLLQGQQGQAPDTVGGLTILNNNANSVLRRIARLFDSSITEPHIRRYYTWLMGYSDDDEAKGDFQIVARGSTALVERDIQGQELVQVLQMSTNPAFELSPARTAAEYLKSRRFDPAAFQLTDEEKQEMAQRQAPEDPRIAAAKIMADASMQRDRAKFQHEAQESDKDRAFEQFMAQLTADLDAQLDARAQAGQQTIAFSDIKAMLAATTMKLQTQKELSAHSAAMKQTSTPPTEPAGTAPAGHAYEA